MSRVGLGYFSACQHYCLWAAGRASRPGQPAEDVDRITLCVFGARWMDDGYARSSGPADSRPVYGDRGSAARRSFS